MINEKIEEIKVNLGQNKVEFQSLFENSNAQTEVHRAYIEETDKKRLADMNWVRDAHEKYTQMMKDFKDFKVETNRLYTDMATQYRVDVLSMKERLDKYYLKQTQIKNKIDIVNSSHETFETQRDGLFKSIADLKCEMIDVQENKMNFLQAQEAFFEHANLIKQRTEFSDIVKN